MNDLQSILLKGIENKRPLLLPVHVVPKQKNKVMETVANWQPAG